MTDINGQIKIMCRTRVEKT